MDRPNVLLIHTDQQRWDAVGVNGNDHVQTPNLDALAADGITFDRYFVQAPVCMPSRASYLTGQYPSQLGIYTNGVTLPPDTETLPRMLRNYGYTSANIGKLHFQNHANRDHRERHPDYGFDHLELSDEPGTYRDDYRAWVGQTAPDQLDDVSWGPSPAYEEWCDMMGVDTGIDHLDPQPQGALATPADRDASHSAFVAEQSMAFMEAHAHDEPFLCVAGFYPPHRVPRRDHPWMAPQEFLDLYDPEALPLPDFPPEVDAERNSEDQFDDDTLRAAVHGYYAMVSHVDYHVGRMLDHLAELGLEEDTLVIFTSDHGEYLGDFLTYGKGFPGEDASSRVPLIVRWPDNVDDPGRTDSTIVEAVDLVPTILDAAGIHVPPHLRGSSLRPAFEGTDLDGWNSALIEGRPDPSTPAIGRALRTERYHYVIEPSGEESLYDLDAEFGAYRDVSTDDAYADALADCRHQLLVRVNASTTPRRRTWLY